MCFTVAVIACRQSATHVLRQLELHPVTIIFLTNAHSSNTKKLQEKPANLACSAADVANIYCRMIHINQHYGASYSSHNT